MSRIEVFYTLFPAMVVVAFYTLRWLRAGMHVRLPVVVRYEPPNSISPALLRYIWKQRFDDRIFWAGILSLVSKGFASLETDAGRTYARRIDKHPPLQNLPTEEVLLMNSLLRSGKRVSLQADDPKTSDAIWQLARKLRSIAVGVWFSQNRETVIVGVLLSVMAVCVVANPQSLQQWIGLMLAIAVMAPGGYYLFFVCLRAIDFARATREHVMRALLPQFLFLSFLGFACVGSFFIGGLLMTQILSWRVTAVAAFLAVLNVSAFLWLRIPTDKGSALLNEIDGFREFLQSVEQGPMDKLDAPGNSAGLYEKYLPYAIALEVEQSWSDNLLALKSCFQEQETMGVRPFYLGSWDGNPVEVVYKPEPNSRRGW